MFYRTSDPHGLPRDPFKSLIVPRPIAWVSTMSAGGVVNLAPFSFFNGVSDRPPAVMIACNGPHAEGGVKDTLANIQATGEFVVNIVTSELRDAMNATSAALPRGVDEMAEAGLEPAPSNVVRPPRVAASPAQLECTRYTVLDLPSDQPGSPNNVIIGHVVGIHISDDILTGGFVDMTKFRPLARLGYMDYSVVDNHFTMRRPQQRRARVWQQ